MQALKGKFGKSSSNNANDNESTAEQNTQQQLQKEEPCAACGLTVPLNQRFQISRAACVHRATCVKCAICKKALDAGTMQVVDGKLYCGQHVPYRPQCGSDAGFTEALMAKLQVVREAELRQQGISGSGNIDGSVANSDGGHASESSTVGAHVNVSQSQNQNLSQSQGIQMPRRERLPVIPADMLSAHEKGSANSNTNTHALDVKIRQLTEMFNDMQVSRIRSTLNDCGGDLDRAVDTLLNLQALSNNQSGGNGGGNNNIGGNTNTFSTVSSANSRPSAPPSLTAETGAIVRGLTQRAGFGPNDIELQLVDACRTGQLAFVRQFLSSVAPALSANANASSRDLAPGRALALAMAAEVGYPDIVTLLLAPDIVNYGLGDGYSVLRVAIEARQSAVAMTLIRNGADVNGRLSAVITAGSGSNAGAGAKARENLLTSVPPVVSAVRTLQGEVMRLLLSQGADPNGAEGSTGQTALHVAAGLPDYDSCSKLLECGADMRIRDRIQGDSPLHTSVRTCASTADVMVTCLLLESAVDSGALNLTTSTMGETALHIVVMRCATPGFGYLVDLVLKYGPDLSVLNAANKTALDIASSIGDAKLIAQLEAAGGQRNVSSAVPTIAPVSSNSIPPMRPPPTVPGFGTNGSGGGLSGGNTNNGKVSGGLDSSGGVVRPVMRPPGVPPMRGGPPPAVPPVRGTPPAVPPMRGPLPSTASAAGAAASATKSSAQSGNRPVRPPLEPRMSTTFDPDWVLVASVRDDLRRKVESGAYAREYDEIEAATANVNLTADFTSALLPCNHRKNRYKNILPYESTRIILQPIERVEGSDFISGNYVSGELPGQEDCYIGTQGPLQSTVGDFWRMVWETNSRVIVMLANEVENGKEKCYPYWPDEKSYDIEYMRIRLKSIRRGEEIVTREFDIEELGTGEKRLITQFQYIAWPDQGIPDSTGGFCELVDLVDDCNRRAIGKKQGGDNEGHLPTVVHCSAGIGRTGTFAVFHATLSKLKLLLTQSYDAVFDVKQTLLSMREQRAGMVQTVEQYEFCYKVIIDKFDEVMRLLQYKNELWFHKGLDSKTALQMLRHEPHGTFLFRDSSAPGCIVLSAMNGKNVLHARISVDHRGFQIENDFYPDLATLVNGRAKVLIKPLLRHL